MSEYPRPANGFGQAAANSTNGFGGAAGNSTNDFGFIHPLSPPHPSTDLVGGSGVSEIYAIEFTNNLPYDNFLLLDSVIEMAGDFTVNWTIGRDGDYFFTGENGVASMNIRHTPLVGVQIRIGGTLTIVDASLIPTANDTFGVRRVGTNFIASKNGVDGATVPIGTNTGTFRVNGIGRFGATSFSNGIIRDVNFNNVAAYPCNDRTGLIATDSIGNNNATLSTEGTEVPQWVKSIDNGATWVADI